MAFQPGNTLGRLNKGHRDYLTREQRIASGPKISAAKKGRPLSDANRAALQAYWAGKKGKTTRTPYGKVVLCQYCTKAVYKYPRDLKRVKNTFCSRACAYKFKDRGATGARQKAMKTSAYRMWREHIFQRDDYTCQSCKQRGGRLIADHELSYANFPDLRLEVLNGRTLCNPCHERTPNYGTRASNDILL